MQSLTQTEEQKGLRQFLENYNCLELESQILDLQKEGFTFEFISSKWNLSRVYYKQKEILIGVSDLEEDSVNLKLVLAHEIAHVLGFLNGEFKEDKLIREIKAWKRALAILNLLEDKISLKFAQYCINTYLKSESDLCMCPSCKEKRREVK